MQRVKSLGRELKNVFLLETNLLPHLLKALPQIWYGVLSVVYSLISQPDFDIMSGLPDMLAQTWNSAFLTSINNISKLSCIAVVPPKKYTTSNKPRSTLKLDILTKYV